MGYEMEVSWFGRLSGFGSQADMCARANAYAGIARVKGKGAASVRAWVASKIPSAEALVCLEHCAWEVSPNASLMLEFTDRLCAIRKGKSIGVIVLESGAVTWQCR